NSAPLRPFAPISAPAAFAGDLARALGPYKTVGWSEDTSALNAERVDEQAFLDDLEQTMDEVRASTLRELGRPDWDLLVSVFTQTDRVAHMFYRFLDPDHPRYDAVLAARFGDAVLRGYRARARGGGRSRDRRALRRPGVPGPRDLPRRAARAHARPAARLPRRLSHLVAHAARRHPEGPPRAQPEEVERRPCRLRRGGHAGRHPRLAPPRGRRSGDRRPGPDGARLLRCARPGRDGRPRAPGGDAVTGARTRALGAGVAGGLVAGAAVGAAEALAAWVHLHGPGELPALGWAL